MRGNMYEWVGYTWNPLAGSCPHDCEYCYVKSLIKRYPQLRNKYTGPIRLDHRTLNQKLPTNRTIFVCSMNDLFAEEVPEKYIVEIIAKTFDYEGENVFLFQTKNPARILKEEYHYEQGFPYGSIIATTIESNRDLIKTKAPSPEERYRAMKKLRYYINRDGLGWKLMLTIEPILEFDTEMLLRWIRDIKPDFINIGADSKGYHLPEPKETEITFLVQHLRKLGFRVHLKKNLRRIAPSLFQNGGDEDL